MLIICWMKAKESAENIVPYSRAIITSSELTQSTGEQVNPDPLSRLPFCKMQGYSLMARNRSGAINPFSCRGGVALWWHTPRLIRTIREKQWRVARGVAGSLNASPSPFCRIIEYRERSFRHANLRQCLDRMDFRSADSQCGEIASHLIREHFNVCIQLNREYVVVCRRACRLASRPLFIKGPKSLKELRTNEYIWSFNAPLNSFYRPTRFAKRTSDELTASKTNRSSCALNQLSQIIN